MEARDGTQGKTEPGAKTRQLGPADLGRARPLGREIEQARSDTQRRQRCTDLLPSVTLPAARAAFARNHRSMPLLQTNLRGVPP
jgi:hypothetical protein